MAKSSYIHDYDLDRRIDWIRTVGRGQMADLVLKIPYRNTRREAEKSVTYVSGLNVTYVSVRTAGRELAEVRELVDILWSNRCTHLPLVSAIFTLS